MQIDLHIGALALSGLPAVDGERLGAALSAELARLFVERGIPRALAEPWQADAVQLAPLQLPPGATTEFIGNQLAQNLYDSLRSASSALAQ